jgi:hypothetical protein
MDKFAEEKQAACLKDLTLSDGITLAEDVKTNMEELITSEQKKLFKAEFGNEAGALEELLNSDGWGILTEYLHSAEFDIEGANCIEKLAITKAKEDVIKLILQLPELLINNYKENIGEGKNG